jgi:5-(carboxyamino)imidazole ribonucleotide mutase
VEIFAVADKELAQKLADYRTKMIQEVEKKAARVAAQL